MQKYAGIFYIYDIFAWIEKYNLYFCIRKCPWIIQQPKTTTMPIIPRPYYIDRIFSRLNRDMMIFLIGQRRVGKSYILRQIHNALIEKYPEATVVYINKELQSFSHITTAQDLYLYADSQMKAGGDNYLLIDEVQDIENYENTLRSLHAEGRCQIIATGSNAYVFSSELSTRLAGRYIEIPVYSLTYKEFLVFHQLSDSEDSLQAYLRVGGLPGLCHFDIEDEGQVRDYLQGVYNTIMMRDVISREQIRNVPFMENLSCFLADNIGKPVSARNISSYLQSHGEKVSEPLSGTYISYLIKSLIINQVARYDLHGKKLFEQNYKYYFADHGLRNLLCGFNLRGNIEKIIENVIYSHLCMLGFRVYIGILRAGEIDFVAVKDNKTLYVQATYLLASDETVRREFGNLAAIKDNYPKYVVSMDPVSGDLPDYPGIIHLNLRDFLKQQL